MHELAARAPRRNVVQPALDEVFDRLHVVVRLTLYALDLRSLGVGDLCGERVQRGQRLGGQAAQLHYARLGGERFQPQRLHSHALADQAALAEDGAQLRGLVGVASIDRGNRVQGGWVHCYNDTESAWSTARADAAGAWSSLIEVGVAKDDLRIERDSLGELKVRSDALWGAQTQRAIENFPLSGLRMPRDFIRALGLIKWAAAMANVELGGLDAKRAAAIQKAALEVADGRHDAHFPVDVFQTGSGTSSNMNANEVIARLASQFAGLAVHPNDH